MGQDEGEDDEVALRFPEELQNLTSLRELKLEGSNLNAVPSFVNWLTGLERLNLSYNGGLGAAGAPGFGFAAEFPSMPRLASSTSGAAASPPSRRQCSRRCRRCGS